MKADIVTIFPDFFRGPLEYGITRRAQEMGLAEIKVHDLREFTHDRHRTVDDRPFGGGEGMVLKPEPLFECLESLESGVRERNGSRDARSSRWFCSRRKGSGLVSKLQRSWLCSTASFWSADDMREWTSESRSFFADREISIGDYVLSGGEIAAAVIVEAVMRLLPGAVGNQASTQQESFTVDVKKSMDGADSTCGSNGLLDYPHYTRPSEFRGMAVPEALMSGNHEEIRRWRETSGAGENAS